MGRAKKGAKQKKPVETYDSDDERAYSKEGVPDPTSKEYFMDDVDEFHAEREKVLLDKGMSLEPAPFSSDEEEVLGIDSNDDDDETYEEMKQRLQTLRSQGIKETMASDLEDEEDDGKAAKREQSWGQVKRRYYGGHDVEKKHADVSDDEPDAAELEEQEAMIIQRRLAEQLDEEDAALHLFKPSQKAPEGEAESQQVAKDLSALSKREKLELLKKQAPELSQLTEDFKARMKELMTTLLPIKDLIEAGKLPANTSGADYIRTKVQLCLNYLVNVNFYMTLRARRTPVENHPVIQRLVQYRNLIRQLEEVEPRIQGDVADVMRHLEQGVPLPEDYSIRPGASPAATKVKDRKERPLQSVSRQKARKLSQMMNVSDDEEADPGADPGKGGRSWGRKVAQMEDTETSGEKQALDYYDMMKAGRKKRPPGALSAEEEQADPDTLDTEPIAEGMEEYQREGAGENERRAIDYQISKNKGLTPKRKKEQRNPRVKHKLKFRKANIRRRGMIREHRFEMEKYGGEISGIRAGVKKSIRLK